MNKKQKNILFLTITILIIFLTVFLTRYYYFSQTDYFSDDSSYHVLRQAEHIADTGKPLFEDDLSYGGRTFFFTPLYHYILAIFLFFSKSVLGLKILNNLFASTIVISAFLLTKNITKNNFISIIISLISGFIPIYTQKTLNSLNPYSLFFPLFILLIYFISKLRRESKKYSSTVTVLFLILIMLSPISLILIFGLLFNQILVKIDKLKINKKEIEIFIVSFLFYLWYYFIIYKDVFFEDGFWIIKQNIPQNLIADYFITPSPTTILILIGIIPFVIGSFATYYISNKEKMANANILASTIIMIIIFSYLNLITLELIILILGILMTLISSVGVKLIIDYFIHSKIKHLKLIVTISIIMLVVPSIYSSLNIASTTMDNSLNDEDIEVFEWIKANINNNSVIISPIYDGHLISYFGERKNVVDSNFLMFENIDQRIIDLRKIYVTPFYIETIKLAFEKYGASYILVNDKARKTYDINDLRSYDESCFKIVYENNKTNDIIYQIIC